MFCKNCGKENTDGSQVCKFCGQDLMKTGLENNSEKAVETTESNKKSKKTKIIIISVILILVLLVGFALFFMFRTTTPDIEQLKSDFTSEVFKDDKYSISEFNITSESDGKNDQYKAIADVTYSDNNVEYHRQYEFVYNKYKEWILDDVNSFSKDSWKIIPIAIPSATDYTEICQSSVPNRIQYDTFTPIDSKTTADLNSGKATFVFSVEKNTVIQKISGEIEFHFSFNDKNGKWELSDSSYADSYNEQYDLVKTWSGKGQPYLFTNRDDNFTNFEFKVTKYEEDSVEGVLTYNNKNYNMSGSVSKSPDSFAALNLQNISDKKSIEMRIHFDGSANANIDTDYNPNNIVYFGYQQTRFDDVKMSLS